MGSTVDDNYRVKYSLSGNSGECSTDQRTSRPRRFLTFSCFIFITGEVRCEAPNNKLDNFTGTLALRGEKYALDNEKMLLRGCTIRNTEWCFGLVIYAGR